MWMQLDRVSNEAHEWAGWSLDRAIAAFKEALPGWWFSFGECSVSCDASCGPDRQYADAFLLDDPVFDEASGSTLSNPAQ